MTPIQDNKFPLTFATGCGLFATLAACFLFASVFLLTGLDLNGLIFPAALALGLVTASLSTRSYIRAFILFSGLIFLSISIAYCTTDFSFDGTFYHQEGVVSLANGWNPWYSEPTDSLWVNHYAIGMEIMQAAAYLTIGRLEAAKCVNIMLILSASLIFAGTLRSYCPAMKRSLLIWLSLIVALNPVGITQFATFYIDFSKYYLWLITLCATAILYRADKTAPRIAMASIILFTSLMAFALKFNIGFEQALLLLAIFAWSCLHKPARKFMPRYILVIGLLTIILVVVLCSHPYLTNWIDYGHPLYPLCGEGKVDIMTRLTPDRVASLDRLSAFFISLARPVPPIYDTALGGFGFLTPIIIILTLIAWVKFRHHIPSWCSWLALFSLVSCFLYPQSWWARYICQLWIVPVAICTALTINGSGKRWVVAIAMLVIINAAAAAGRTAYLMIRTESWQQNISLSLHSSPLLISTDLPQFKTQAYEHGIDGVICNDHIPGAASDSVAIPWNPHMPDHIFVVLSNEQWRDFKRYQDKSLFGPKAEELTLK